METHTIIDNNVLQLIRDRIKEKYNDMRETQSQIDELERIIQIAEQGTKKYNETHKE